MQAAWQITQVMFPQHKPVRKGFLPMPYPWIQTPEPHMSWYANQFLHFCRLRDQTNTKVALFLTGGKVGCTSFCTLELTNNTNLANHGKEFVSFSTCGCHLIHYPTRSSNNMILNLKKKTLDPYKICRLYSTTRFQLNFIPSDKVKQDP